MQWYKNASDKGGAQAHAIKTATKDSIIIASHTNNKGRMWGNTIPNHFLHLLEKNHGIYEIITSYPHKVYFDIDEEKPVEDFQSYINASKQTILTYFPDADFAISGSHTETKTSLHIILSNYLICNEHQRNCMKTLCKELGWDWKVYTNNRLMKCINQSKPDGRVQSILENDDFKKHTITSFIGASLPFPKLPEYMEEKVNATSTFDLALLPKMVLTTEIDMDNLTPSSILSLLPINTNFHHSYTHLVARYCYYNELSVEQFISWYKNKKQDNISIKKWIEKWESLGNFPPVTDAKIKQILSNFYPQFKKDIHFRNFKKSFEIGQTYPIETITQSCFQVQDKYLLFNTGMGSGKTAQTAMYLKTQSNSCWIAPNKALAKNTEHRLKCEGIDVQHYLNFASKDKNNGILNTCEHLICVLNSIHYVSRNYDVIIIDEVETVFDKFLGDFMEKKQDIWNNFIRMLKSASRVILLDAFITQKTISFLKMLESEVTPIVYVRKYEPQTRTIYYMKEFEEMILDIQTKLSDNKKLFIFYPYKNMNKMDYPSMENLVKVLQSNGKIGIAYNADIDDSLKAGLMNINDTWKNYDFVITNNVITCGVNYENLDFDYKYLFIASFNTPRDMIQVSYRARHLNTGIIKVCYLKGQPPDVFLKDTEKIQCHIYTSLYNSIMIERMCPLRRSFQLFCTKAHYKQDTDTQKFDEILKQQVHDKLLDEELQFRFHSIEPIDSHLAEMMKQKVFNQEATMYEKIQLTKYYYTQSIDEEYREHNNVANLWNDGLLNFVKQVGKVLLDEQSVFHKIAKLNKWNLFPHEEVFRGSNGNRTPKIKLDNEILEQIFNEFKFRTITRASKPAKIIQSIYNLYFKTKIICSVHDSMNSHTIYSLQFISINEDLEWIKSALILNHEVGTYKRVVREDAFSADVDEFFEI